MIQTLKIQNLVLIEHAEIGFGPDLNIITGETGSGKSVLLTAIRLIAGSRGEISVIQNGKDFAVVEAVLFDGTHIRRELYRSGKNRCFIDEAQVTLGKLKERVGIELVSQNSSHSLFEDEMLMLDSFSGLSSLRKEIAHSLEKEKELKSELETLQKIPKERELEWAKEDLKKIDRVDFKSEESFVQEHHLLTHSQDLAEKMSAVSFSLNDSSEISHLKRAYSLLEKASFFDESLKSLSASMKNALLELDEVGRATQSYVETLEADPKRLEFIENVLGEIEALKRRFGGDIESEKKKLIEKIETLATLEEKIIDLEKKLHELIRENQKQLQKLISIRKEKAPQFVRLILSELESLNLPQAQFEIHVGDQLESVSFFFSANPGQGVQPLESCASGGELSRLLLVMKTLLADGTSTLVFDEIDSNVGGHTASILGQKLQKLSLKRQVISVTHFVQVAKYASTHLLVSKKIEGSSATTLLRKLNEKEKELEYSRMLGTRT